MTVQVQGRKDTKIPFASCLRRNCDISRISRDPALANVAEPKPGGHQMMTKTVSEMARATRISLSDAGSNSISPHGCQ